MRSNNQSGLLSIRAEVRDVYVLPVRPYCNAFWATPTGISGKYSNFAEDRLRLGMKKENPLASLFILLSPCTIFAEDRLRLGIKNENPLAFLFILLSPCTIFVAI